MNPQQEFTFQKPRLQAFNLPYGMMTFVTQKNANHVVYSKLITTCKHFFAKNPLLMVEDVFYSQCSLDYNMLFKNKGISLSLESLQASKSKLWITQQITFLRSQVKIAASNIVKKLYRFDGSQLWICGQELTLQEYMVLTLSKNLSYVNLFQSTFLNDDGTFASVKSLVDPIQNVERFW